MSSWRKSAVGVDLLAMKTLTVEEASSGLGRLVDLALAGEQIQIRKGENVVELRPTQDLQAVNGGQVTPREALRRLQGERMPNNRAGGTLSARTARGTAGG